MRRAVRVVPGPSVARPDAPSAPRHHPVMIFFVAPRDGMFGMEDYLRQFQEALERLDSPEDPGRTIRIRVSEGERRKLEAEKRAIERLRARKTVISQLVRPLARLVRPLLGP